MTHPSPPPTFQPASLQKPPKLGRARPLCQHLCGHVPCIDAHALLPVSPPVVADHEGAQSGGEYDSCGAEAGGCHEGRCTYVWLVSYSAERKGVEEGERGWGWGLTDVVGGVLGAEDVGADDSWLWDVGLVMEKNREKLGAIIPIIFATGTPTEVRTTLRPSWAMLLLSVAYGGLVSLEI